MNPSHLTMSDERERQGNPTAGFFVTVLFSASVWFGLAYFLGWI